MVLDFWCSDVQYCLFFVGFGCTIHMSSWMLQTKTSHLWKARYAIILIGWRYESFKINPSHSVTMISVNTNITHELYFNCEYILSLDYLWMELLNSLASLWRNEVTLKNNGLLHWEIHSPFSWQTWIKSTNTERKPVAFANRTG